MAMMIQRWEYMVIERTRSANIGGPIIGLVAGPWDKDIPMMLNQIGADGWFLVEIVPRVGSQRGITTEEMWVFRRPRL